MFYERILRELGKSKIKYLVVGGLAVNLHGYDRITADLDIILLLKDSNLTKFVAIVKKLKLKPRLPVRIEDFADVKKRRVWIQEKNMKAFALYNPENETEHLDIVIDYAVDFDEAYKNKEVIKAGDLKIPVIAIPELVQMKKYAGRERDKIDIRALLRIERLNNGQKT